ncbi:MAG: SulP family inorganic anion transporter [Oscillospiraceae bacterium]|nr:SulP family inorganic anion transporter [Oscillospiraceae bacterium]
MIQGKSVRTLPRDIMTGVIIALVSIPISMGYAQIAGLPAVYGLYGSIFPILIFGLLSDSPQFIFGVDAAPAALIGGFLVPRGIGAGTPEAMAVVPLLTLLVAVWLLIFAVLRAGKLVVYISTPVMGGFISGICSTIILMQLPKMLGGTSGTGELPELVLHLAEVCRTEFHGMTLLYGAAALAVLLMGKKYCPRVPMAVVVMALGALLGFSGIAQRHGVRLLEAVPLGLPAWSFPSLAASDYTELLTVSLTVAAVIMTETLLAAQNFAQKNHYALRENHEIMIYGLCNLAACLTGCCAVNGSVSRTAMGEQYGGKSQVMSITAALSMMLILLMGTGFIGCLPVPVLTAIVISALLGAVEFDLAHRLYQQDKKELLIFLSAFLGVLLFGTVKGVIIGVILSFVSLVLKTANPKRSFLGVIEGHEGFHSLERNTLSFPISNVILYRFSSNLYFANVKLMIDDLEAAIQEDTRCIVVDSGAICNIDVTAADRLESFRKSLNQKGIELYFASHIGALNDRFRELGLEGWVEHGYVRRTIPAALRNAGFQPPYRTEKKKPQAVEQQANLGTDLRLEFEWAFGAGAESELEQYTEIMLEQIDENASPDEQLSAILKAKGVWRSVSDSDQEELLTHLQAHIRELSAKLHLKESEIEEAIEARRMKLALRLMRNNPRAADSIRQYNMEAEAQMQQADPELYERLMAYRKESLSHLQQLHPEYAEIIHKFYE